MRERERSWFPGAIFFRYNPKFNVIQSINSIKRQTKSRRSDSLAGIYLTSYKDCHICESNHTSVNSCIATFHLSLQCIRVVVLVIFNNKGQSTRLALDETRKNIFLSIPY